MSTDIETFPMTLRADAVPGRSLGVFTDAAVQPSLAVPDLPAHVEQFFA